METDQSDVSSTISNVTTTSVPVTKTKTLLPEADLYLNLLVLVFLLDHKKNNEVKTKEK